MPTGSTLTQLLARYEWLFYEKGMMHVWNELKRISNDALTAYTGGVSAVILSGASTDLDTGITERVDLTTPVDYINVPTGPPGAGRPPTQAQG